VFLKSQPLCNASQSPKASSSCLQSSSSPNSSSLPGQLRVSRKNECSPRWRRTEPKSRAGGLLFLLLIDQPPGLAAILVLGCLIQFPAFLGKMRFPLASWTGAQSICMAKASVLKISSLDLYKIGGPGICIFYSVIQISMGGTGLQHRKLRSLGMLLIDNGNNGSCTKSWRRELLRKGEYFANLRAVLPGADC
jgi:hypothetical protein